MNYTRHGLTVGLDRIDNEFLLTLKVSGKLTHEDYQTIIPMLEAAIAGIEKPHIKVLVDVMEMEGWELRAAWDDLKLGLKHGGKFTQVAIVGDEDWQEMFAKVSNWFISGEVRIFHQHEAALDWLR